MEKRFNATRWFFICLSGGVVILIFFIFSFFTTHDGKLHLVVCDVGQGDAIVIRMPQGQKVVTDGGPDRSMLSCLGKLIPFWDREIDLVILTHPQADHMVGLIELLKRYRVKQVIATTAVNQTAEYVAWTQELSKQVGQGLQLSRPHRGDTITFGQDVVGTIEWPQNGETLADFRGDLNETSVVWRLSYGRFCALLTGDASKLVFDQMTEQEPEAPCLVLKVPHHGSKTGFAPKFLAELAPSLALISVGRNNRYHHPAGEVLEALSAAGMDTKRTDQAGAIEIVTDGSTWYTKTER